MGGIEHMAAVTGDPALKLRTVRVLIEAGYAQEQIQAALRISPATFHRRYAELRRHNPRITCPTLRSSDLNRDVEMVQEH